MENVKQKKKFMNFRPFLCFAVYLAMGILSAYFFALSNKAVFIVCLSIFIISIVLFFTFSRLEILYKSIFILVFIIFFAMGDFLFTGKLNKYKAENLNGMYLTVTGTVKECKDNQEGQSLILSNVEVKGAINKELNYGINVYTKSSSFSVGDRIKFNGYIHDYSEVYNEKFSAGFISEKIKHYTYIDGSVVSLIESDLTVFEKVNRFIKDTLKEGMDDEEFSIAYSLLLGKSDYMDDDVLTSFRQTGVAHIFAVSGLHIGFLALALEFILSKVRIKKTVRAGIIVLALFFYSGVCGFTASSIRACIMTSVLLISNIRGKKYDVLSSISLAFTIILLVSPMQLFCLGFLLSFSAVLGIVLFSNKLKKIIMKIKIPEKIANACATSISAQIITLLILIKTFNGVSIISVLVNILLVPIVGVIFVMLFVLLIIGGIFSIETVALFIPSVLIKGIKYVVLFFDREFLLVTFAVTVFSAVLYYLCVLISSGLLNIKIIIKRFVCLCLSIGFIGITVVYTIQNNNLSMVTLISNGSLYSAVVEDDGKTFVIVNNATENFSMLKLNYVVNEDIDGLVLLCDKEQDEKLYYLVNRFNEYYDIENIYLQVSKESRNNFRKSFSNGLYFIETDKSFSVGKINCSIVANDNAIVLEKGGQKILLFSKIDGERIDYNLFNETFDYLVVSDHIDNLKGKIKHRELITYSSDNGAISVCFGGRKVIKL